YSDASHVLRWSGERPERAWDLIDIAWPGPLHAGDRVDVTWIAENRGTSTWQASDAMTYRILNRKTGERNDGPRCALKREVQPGEWVACTVQLSVPEVPGMY